MAGETQADPADVDAVLAVGRLVISPGAEAGVPTAAQCRALGLLASCSHWRLADLAGALGVAPSSAGRPARARPFRGFPRSGLARRSSSHDDR